VEARRKEKGDEQRRVAFLSKGAPRRGKGGQNRVGETTEDGPKLLLSKFERQERKRRERNIKQQISAGGRLQMDQWRDTTGK